MQYAHNEGIISSLSMFEDFLKSSIWADIKSELDVWKKDIQGIQDTTSDDRELYRCQGRKEAIENFLSLPEIIIDYMESRDGK